MAQILPKSIAKKHMVVPIRATRNDVHLAMADPLNFVAVEEVRAEGMFLYLTLLLKAQNPGLNPDVLLRGFREEYPDFPVCYTACHRVEIFDEEKQVYR